MAYISVADLKAYRSIDETTDDALLAEFISVAEAWIDNEAGTTFEATSDTTRTFDAVKNSEGATLWLDYDLCAVTSVTNGDAVVVASDEYVTIPSNSTPWNRIKLLASADKAWTYTDDPEDAISIVGRWGYSTAAPMDIRHATRRLAAYLYAQRDTMTDLDRPIAAGDGNILLPAQVPDDIYAVLRKYKRQEYA